MICVETLNTEQPNNLTVSPSMQWNVHADLDQLEAGLSRSSCQANFVILPIRASSYFNEVMFALRHRNRGIPVLICTYERFPKDIAEDVLHFLSECVLDRVPVKAEVLFDEYALELIDKRVLEQIIKHFEAEML